MDEKKRYALEDELSNIRAKLLIVWGKHDRVSVCLL